MRFMLSVNIRCPKCTQVLMNHARDEWPWEWLYSSCQNDRCEMYGIKFKLPTIELEEITE